MKKTWKKVLAALLCVAMVLAMAACGNSAPQTQAPANEPAADNQPTAPAENKEAPVTVKWICTGSESEALEAALAAANKVLLERYNLQLDLTVIPSGTYNDKLNMMINSGEDWDVAFTSQSWLLPYPAQINKGAFLALDDYLADHPDLVAAIPEFVWDAVKEGGVTYAVPNYQISTSSWGFLFQKPIIDEMAAAGVDFDYTKVEKLEDFYPYLEFVKQNHPELYPARLYQAIDTLPNPEVTDRYYVLGYEIYLDTETGELVNSILDLTMEEQIEKSLGQWVQGMYQRELLEKGYYREDIATVQDDTAEYAAGRYASISGITKPGGEVETSANMGGVEIVQVRLTNRADTSPGRAAMTAINANSKNPEAAVKMVEIINTDAEIFNMLIFGVEGVNYDMIDGKLQQRDGMAPGPAAWALGNQFNAYEKVGQPDGVWQQTDELNRSADPCPVPGFSFSTENIAEAVAAYDAVVAEYKNWFFEDDYEERYEAFIQKLTPPLTTIYEEFKVQFAAYQNAQ